MSRPPCAAPNAGPVPTHAVWRFASPPGVILFESPLENSIAQGVGTAKAERAIPALRMDGPRERPGHLERETGGQLH